MQSQTINTSNKTNINLEEELKSAFDYFDSDNSGTISKEELEIVMKKLGLNPTQVEIEEMLEEADNEGNGQIDFYAFKRMLTKTLKDDFTLQAILEAFSIFDKNKTGKIEKREIVNILMKSCYMERHEVDDLLDDICNEFDENNEIDYNVFVKETFRMLNN